MSIPTLLVVRDGEEVDRVVGALPEQQLEERLAAHLGARQGSVRPAASGACRARAPRSGARAPRQPQPPTDDGQGLLGAAEAEPPRDHLALAGGEDPHQRLGVGVVRALDDAIEGPLGRRVGHLVGGRRAVAVGTESFWSERAGSPAARSPGPLGRDPAARAAALRNGRGR